MDVDPKLIILVISNQINGQELFRIHIHEQTIRFDDKFQEGIDGNGELKREIQSLNEMWKSQKIKQHSIFPIMLDIMVRYGDYIKDYYFDESELDNKGQFIEKSENQQKPEKFFRKLQENGLLTKITKKNFQLNIRSREVAEKYVDVHETKSSYFQYQLYRKPFERESWFFMEKGGRLKLCFLNLQKF
jgi:hypothetical protein